MKLLIPALVLMSASVTTTETGRPGTAVHRLTDGTLIEAQARIGKREVRLATPFGDRVITRAEYGGKANTSLDALAAEYRAAAKKLKVRDIAGHRALAEQCRSKGYLTGLRRQLNVLLASDTDDKWARMILSQVAAVHRVHRDEGVTKGRKLRKFIDFLLEDLARRDNVGAVIAAEKARTLPQHLVFRPATKALKHSKTRVRWVGAHLLRDVTGKPARVQNLFRRSLQDGVFAVRRECVRALKTTDDGSMVNVYAAQLSNPDNTIKARAAQALGELGAKAAAAPLAKALAASFKPNRVHIINITQMAYVKDYDVEVAQTAFIADPIVDILQEGSILEVALISVGVVRHVYRNNLRRLTGVDLGTDPKAWRDWVKKNVK
ncbi:MAG: hypothetical protein CMJ83_20530 [Planctomycetes bacterium]|nr:hypothetical protein [Planctomycetota bacterium]